jgi:mono/diheme cytochrome c family protein
MTITRMKALTAVLVGLGAALSAAPPSRASSVSAPAEDGEWVFRTYCASCHGTSAKGDGPLAASLRVAPADLTLLARRAHGKFDAEQVRKTIDGRQRVVPHGNSDMPVWGDAFRNSADGYSEEKVKTRIKALVDYLEKIQAK